MLIPTIVFMPFIAGFISWLIGRKSERVRDIFVIIVSFIELILCMFLPSALPSFEIHSILGSGLTFTTNGFRAVYAIITAIMWAGTSLFSKEYFAHERENLNRYWFFILLTLGATEGVMLSGDLMTSFVFFEILSFTSFTWVIHEENTGAIRAGYTYLFIAVIGGLILFMGLALMQNACGTLSFETLKEAAAASAGKKQIYIAAVCILIGFGAKAGMFPVHVWLPKAHPVAPSPASALLSGILTKVGIYGILMTSITAMYGSEALGTLILILGVITMVLGAVLGVFSINLKRTLACSSMSQIGFILIGIAMTLILQSVEHEEGMVMALSGAMLHMMNHSLIKLTLFMAAGVVVMNLETLILDDIRGWGRNKTTLKIAFALGALGISGVPLFNGYISKTLLHEGIVEGIHALPSLAGMLSIVEWIFLFSGGLTFAYMLKLFICIFIEKNKDEKLQQKYDANSHCMNAASTIAILGSSLFMVILGQPSIMTKIAAFMTGNDEILNFAHHAFIWTNLKGSLISLSIGALVYLFVIRGCMIKKGSYINLWPQKLDLEDLIYRPLLTRILPNIFGSIVAVFGENKVLTPIAKGVLKLGAVVARLLSDSTDMLVLLLRKTVIREKPVNKAGAKRLTKWGVFKEETTMAMQPLTENFTFAMMMTCIGILLVLGVLVWYTIL